MRFLTRALALAATFVTLAAVTPVAAQVTIGSTTPDNAVGPFGKDGFFTGVTGTVAQTFSTTAANPLLQSFTFQLSEFFGGADLLVQASIFEFAANAIVGSALYTSAIRAGSSNIFGYDALSFVGVNTLLNPGTVYALLLRPTSGSPDGATNLVGTTTANTFGPGQLFTSAFFTDAQLHNAGAFTPSSSIGFGADAAVQMTFSASSVTVTPEPATITLMAIGLAGLATVRRRRRVTTTPTA